jgi:hypothetical protein
MALQFRRCSGRSWGAYEGRYRRPAVIHDWYCEHKYRTWERVHYMFYQGMFTAGVSLPQAKLMYYAVWRLGPRWTVDAIVSCIPSKEHMCATSTMSSYEIRTNKAVLTPDNVAEAKKELEAVKEQLSREDLSPEQLEKLADSKLPIQRSGTTEFKPAIMERHKFEDFKAIERGNGNPPSLTLPSPIR